VNLLPDIGQGTTQRHHTESITRTCHEGANMEEYQEELLESQAYELDPVEAAEDATEL
jgi:hypothetical protein